ncbi:UNKNOWN [Stylonychia lemnae]|uniref:Uncharacterized protein n=1 Tax=Stylonychia lemnae TaxID=5949 RepID=A0A078AYG2_STYLE|nr:UNKNOWN [Stylonychia lemnae]|eukprot:CDW87450.1 UNKNOWN [Stylonychia lemnae]
MVDCCEKPARELASRRNRMFFIRRCLTSKYSKKAVTDTLIRDDHLEMPYAHGIRVCFFFYVGMVGRSVS